MLHPLLHLIATRPELLAEHAEGYVDLVAGEVSGTWLGLKKQVIFGIAALFCLGVSVVLIGVALMLWAVTPLSAMPAPWVLVAVPLPTLGLAILCAFRAPTPTADQAFNRVRQQVQADIAMLRAVSSS